MGWLWPLGGLGAVFGSTVAWPPRGGRAGLEPACGDHLLPIPHLDGEGGEGQPQDSVVERRQRWYVAVPADQHVEGASSLAGSSAGGTLAAAVNLLVTISEQLSVNCTCSTKFSRSISGS